MHVTTETNLTFLPTAIHFLDAAKFEELHNHLSNYD